MIDQLSSLFEMFAQYFDRRFFELQEFVYHFNKTVLSANKNFSTIQHQLSLAGKGGSSPMTPTTHHHQQFQPTSPTPLISFDIL
jgi:hypothetical protein